MSVFRGEFQPSGTIQERYTETPYGVVTFRDGSGSTISVSTKGWDILHQGAKTDIIGDYDFRNRVYSPTLGRPLQSDQLQFEAGEANFYRWEGNDPNGHLDPSGNRWTFEDVALGAGTAFLIAGGAVLVVGTGGLATPLVVGGAAAVIGGGLAGHYAESPSDAINIGGATGLAVGSIGAGGVLVARFGVEQAGRIIAGTVASSLTGTNVDLTKPGIPLSGLPVVGPNRGSQTIYKAPQPGKGQKLLNEGFNTDDFPSGGPYADGKAYFAKERALAEQYSGYGEGILEVEILKPIYDARIKPHEIPYLADPRFTEIPIPPSEFDILNNALRRLHDK